MHPTHQLTNPNAPAGTLNGCRVCKAGPRVEAFDLPCSGQAPTKPAMPTKAERYAGVLAKMAEHADSQNLMLGPQALRAITFYALALNKINFDTFAEALTFVAATQNPEE